MVKAQIDIGTTAIDVKTGDRSTNVTVFNDTVEFLSSDVYFKEDQNGNIKYDINYSNQAIERDGWLKTTIKHDDITEINSLKFRIGKQEHYFPMLYRKENCTEVYYKEADVWQEECEYVAKIRTVLNGNYLEIYYNPDNFSDRLYDPYISDWTTYNLTAWWKIEEPTEAIVADYAANPSPHIGSESSSARSFVAGLGAGSTWAVRSNTTYWTIGNKSDFNDLTAFEFNWAMQTTSPSSEVVYLTLIGASNTVRIKSTQSRVELQTDGDATDCNIGWYEYSSFLDTNNTQFITAGYNGTHCYIMDNRSIVRSEAASGTLRDVTDKIRLAADNSVDCDRCTLDCMTWHSGGELTSDARDDVYDECFSSGTPPSDSCDCPGYGNAWEIDLSDTCDIGDCDLGNGSITFTGSGTATCLGNVNMTNMGEPGSDNTLYINNNCTITIW